MNIAVPKEVHEGETRVSMIPEHVAKLVKAGADVAIESGLGQTLRIVDDEYIKTGASKGYESFGGFLLRTIPNLFNSA